MKRKILEITEIDCGDETCDGCEERIFTVLCGRFTGDHILKETGTGFGRLPECREAERVYAAHSRRSFCEARKPKAQGPPDSIGE